MRCRGADLATSIPATSVPPFIPDTRVRHSRSAPARRNRCSSASRRNCRRSWTVNRQERRSPRVGSTGTSNRAGQDGGESILLRRLSGNAAQQENSRRENRCRWVVDRAALGRRNRRNSHHPVHRAQAPWKTTEQFSTATTGTVPLCCQKKNERGHFYFAKNGDISISR
jgi:hypothetical protein